MIRLTSIAIALAVLCLARPAAASLQGELDDMFQSMTTTAPAGYVKTQMRGAFAGGGMHMRNRIADMNLVTLTPPSLEAGCGGINLFTGSFSFINADQFVQLLRNIASNAMGLAFKAALSIISPQLEEKISEIQSIIQKLNEHMKDSCQLAQGLVDAGVDALQGNLNVSAGTMAANLGFGDAAESLLPDIGGENSLAKLQDTDPSKVKDEITGNLVWRALKKNNVATWFRAGDNNLLEAMMNLTGTVIISKISDDGEGATTDTIDIPANNILLSDLLDGGKIPIEGCDTFDANGCLHPRSKTIALTGLEDKVRDTLFGTSSSVGILDKLFTNRPLTDAQKAFLSMQASGIGGLLVQLSKRSPYAAKNLANQSVKYIALDMVSLLVDDMLKAVQTTALADDHSYISELRDKLAEARQGVMAQKDTLRHNIGPETKLVESFRSLMSVMRKEQETIAGLTRS